MTAVRTTVLACLAAASVACSDDKPTAPVMIARDPNTASKVSVDRFSTTAGHLQVRTATNGLPAANAAVDFDTGPFITRGLGPSGQVLTYYNFDTQLAAPAPIYVLFREGSTTPVADQLNIIDVIPGDQNYNDFWQVFKVTVPANYVANSITSLKGIVDAKYHIESTNMLVNCPVVPFGSVARLRLNGESTALTRGWYKDQVVSYFNFGEKALTTTTTGLVPVSPLYAIFNVNPDLAGGGPPSGFKTEGAGSAQTHNVASTIPTDAAYSPLWTINILDNAAFATVHNLATAVAAPAKATGAALVNCPIVQLQ